MWNQRDERRRRAGLEEIRDFRSDDQHARLVEDGAQPAQRRQQPIAERHRASIRTEAQRRTTANAVAERYPS